MKTSLSTYAELNYPIDYAYKKSALMRRLQKQCATGRLKAEKEGKLWVVVDDGKPKKSTNPLLV